MAVKKKVEGEVEHKSLWEQEVQPVTMKKFAEETADTEKIIWFGESNSGKTRGYLDILGYLKAKETPKEKVCMCIIYPDRATGITKLYNLIPKEYVEKVFVFPVTDYETLIAATANSEKILMEHFKKTGVHGWLISELLGTSWRFAQDFYSRKAFGESLADLMAAKRRALDDLKEVKDEKKKASAYQALEGWRDWTIVKFYHNFNWIDKIKRMPFNVGATAEIKTIDNPDSVFSSIKVRPGGEKDNAHKFDAIIYKKHVGNKFTQRCFKLTGYDRIYSEIDITGKNSYAVHQEILQKFEKAGYRSSAIEELEKEAGIPTPKKPEPKVETPKKEEPKLTEEKPVRKTIEPESIPAGESKTISKTPEEESEKKITPEELTTPPKKKDTTDDWDLDI